MEILASYAKRGKLKNDLANKRYGMLLVLYRTRYDEKKVRWMCVCDCGKLTVSGANELLCGKTGSCGCHGKSILGKMRTTHGHTKGGNHTQEYESWAGIIARCKNKNKKQYKDYGGRGITVCDEWLKFENFYADMGNSPEGMTIERVDNNKGYFPGNCIWATMRDQANNTRRSRLIEHNGKTQTIMQWAREKNIYPQTLYNRINILKWSHERAITEPANPTSRIYKRHSK